MGIIKCCILDCKDVCSRRHRFPNPRNDFERYNKWIELIGNSALATIDPQTVYANKRICRRHFVKEYISPGYNRLHRNALPTLFLPGM